MINEHKSEQAVTKLMATVRSMTSYAKDELEKFFRGEKEGNYGITQLSKDVEKRSGVTFGFAYAVCTDYTRSLGMVAKRGRNGGFQIISSPEEIRKIINEDAGDAAAAQ